jgi:hypothetical protein
MWIVYLTGNAANQNKAYDVYRQGYFPRKYRYQQEAVNAVVSLKAMGVLSHFETVEVYESRKAELEAIDNNMLES